MRKKSWIYSDSGNQILNSKGGCEADSELKVNSGKNSEFKEKSRSR